MKKLIFTWAIVFLPLISAPAQETPPSDTGTITTPPPVDTALVLPPSTDTGFVPPPEPGAPADTGAAPTSPQENVPADTGTVHTTPQENPPVDTGASPPPQESRPVDTAAVTPLQPGLPESEAAAEGEETEAPKVTKPVRFGMGIVFNDEAPLSIRAWFNPKVGLDVGIGLKGRRVDDTASITDSTPTAPTRVTMLDLSFDLGIPVRIFRKGTVDFIVRPGFGFRTRPGFFTTTREGTTVRSIESSLELEVNGSVGIEYYPSERLSFGLVTGMALIAERTGGTGNTNFRLESLPSKKGVNYSFRYYLF